MQDKVHERKEGKKRVKLISSGTVHNIEDYKLELSQLSNILT
jgi:hypothetical protein